MGASQKVLLLLLLLPTTVKASALLREKTVAAAAEAIQSGRKFRMVVFECEVLLLLMVVQCLMRLLLWATTSARAVCIMVFLWSV